MAEAEWCEANGNPATDFLEYDWEQFIWLGLLNAMNWIIIKNSPYRADIMVGIPRPNIVGDTD